MTSRYTLAVDVLNRIHRLDPTVLPQLIEFRVPCNEALADDPTVQVQAREICPSCRGTLWTEDENWEPERPWNGERSIGEGLIPCGACNEGGWSVDPKEPGMDPGYEVGLLGIINGLFGVRWEDGPGFIGARSDGDGNLLGFAVLGEEDVR